MSGFITNAELRIEAERLCDENDQLKAENAKLREEFNKMDVWHSKELTAAMAENAKLRELVRAAWRCIHTGASCSDCRLIAGGCTLQTAMRELGVEVDG